MYRQNFEQVVSQAAIHLHNELGSIGTALYNGRGGLLFNNNALHYLDEAALASLVVDCLAECIPGKLTHRTVNGVMVRTLTLDFEHVFIVVGNRLEDTAVSRFFSGLQRMLPKVHATDD
jgi:hypothetical protein